MSLRKTPLPHSHAVRHPAAVRLDQDPAQEIVQVTVVTRARTSRDQRRKSIQQLAALLPGERRHLDRDEFVRLHGSRPEDLDQVATYAKSEGLTVESSPGRRCVVLRGRVADLDRAFGVKSGIWEVNGLRYRSHENPVHVPEQLNEIVMGVLGLEDQPLLDRLLLRPERPQPPRGSSAPTPTAPAPPAAAQVPWHYTEPRAVSKAYGFPADADGRGQSIGIVACGGGLNRKDVEPYLGPGQRLDIVPLDGQENNPADSDCIQTMWTLMNVMWDGSVEPPEGVEVPSGEEQARFRWTMEITADVEVAARFASAADLVVYLVPDSVQGKYAAFTTALVDEHSPQVLSCSWGSAEDHLSRNHLWILDDVFSFAALRGVTLCFSSGDGGDGSQPMVEGMPKGMVAAHFPASSPHVLACGGTMRSGPAEIVWKEDLGVLHTASGGGVSGSFAPPWWQPSAMVQRKTEGRKGRGLPDVSGKADIETGYRITVGGIDMPVGGTSSAAPLWAALIARLNQKLGVPVGYVTPLLYLDRQRFADATTSINEGSNGEYRASAGWDACTGWGTPRGAEILRALGGH